MKKRLLVLVAVLALVLSMAACGPKEPAATDPVASSTPSGNTNLPEEATGTYAAVFQKYQKAISEQWDATKLMAEDMSVICATNHDNLGYAFADITGDGQKELLIGSADGVNSQLFDIYTVVGGTVKHLACSTEMNSYYLYEEGGAYTFILVKDGENENEWISHKYADGALTVDKAVKTKIPVDAPIRYEIGTVQKDKIVYEKAEESEALEIKIPSTAYYVPTFTAF